MVTPKPTTGRLEVPEDIFEKYQMGCDGKEELFKIFEQADGNKDCVCVCFTECWMKAA